MLEQAQIFADLPPEEIEALERHVMVPSFPKNVVILMEGEKSDALYVILEGRVKVFLTDVDGREIIVNIKGAGDHFGELAILADGPRTASVMTVEASRFAVVPGPDFKACLTRNPDIAIGMTRAMALQIRSLTEDVRDLALRDVYQRVSRLLLRLSVEQEGKRIIAERLSHQEIANRTGASREMVGRVMKELSAGGYITVTDKNIAIEKKLPTGW